jgi:hypothetical protein
MLPIARQLDPREMFRPPGTGFLATVRPGMTTPLPPGATEGDRAVARRLSSVDFIGEESAVNCKCVPVRYCGGRERSGNPPSQELAAAERGSIQRNDTVAAMPPRNWASTNQGTSRGLIPAKVSLKHRAIVTAGFANDVDAVNQ